MPDCFYLFYEQDWQEGVFKAIKVYHFLVLLAVWIFFPKFLGRLHTQLFIFLFYDRDWQGRVLKLAKNIHFLVFLAIWFLFSKFLGKLRG